MSQKRLQSVLENARQTGVYHRPESGLAAVREAADAVGLACFEAVSYTHLDVYKRQSQLTDHRPGGHALWLGPSSP